MTQDIERKRQLNLEWVKRRRADYFTGKQCAWCGSADNLQLHHLDRLTKVHHCIWSWSAERREAEIAKCIVLCESCHRKHHAEEMRKPLEHGTYNAYQSYGCRCAVCRRGNTERHRQWAAHRRQEA